MPASGIYFVAMTVFTQEVSNVGYNYLGVYANDELVSVTIAPPASRFR